MGGELNEVWDHFHVMWTHIWRFHCYPILSDQ